MAWCWYWRPFVHCHCRSSSSGSIIVVSRVRKKRRKEHTDGSRQICVSSPLCQASIVMAVAWAVDVFLSLHLPVVQLIVSPSCRLNSLVWLVKKIDQLLSFSSRKCSAYPCSHILAPKGFPVFGNRGRRGD